MEPKAHHGGSRANRGTKIFVLCALCCLCGDSSHEQGADGREGGIPCAGAIIHHAADYRVTCRRLRRAHRFPSCDLARAASRKRRFAPTWSSGQRRHERARKRHPRRMDHRHLHRLALRRWGLEPLDGAATCRRSDRAQRGRRPACAVLRRPPVLHGKEMTVTAVGGPAIAGPLQKGAPARASPRARSCCCLRRTRRAPPKRRVPRWCCLSSRNRCARAGRRRPPGRPLSMQWWPALRGRPHAASTRRPTPPSPRLRTGHDEPRHRSQAGADRQDLECRGPHHRRRGAGARSDCAQRSPRSHRNSERPTPSPAPTPSTTAPTMTRRERLRCGTGPAMAMGERPERPVIFAWFGSEE